MERRVAGHVNGIMFMKDLLRVAYRALLRDDRGLVLLVFILYTRISAQLSAYHGINRVMTLVMGVLALAIVTRWLIDGERTRYWVRPALWIGVYITICMASIRGAEEPDRAWAGIEFLFKSTLLVMVLVTLVHSAENLRRVVWAVIFAGIAMGSICTVQSLLGLSENHLGGFAVTQYSHIVGKLHAFRAGGTINDPNYFAQVMVVVFPLAIERLWAARQRLHLILPAWALFVSLYTVVLTYSRAGVLAIFVMVVLLMPMLVRRRPRPINLAVMGVVLLALVPILPEGYVSRMTGLHYVMRDDTTKSDEAKTTSQKLLEEPSFRGRLSENIVSLQMFRDHPLLGVGLNNYQVNYQRYSQPLGLDPRTERRSAHNLYLESFAETGLLGGVVFCSMLCVLVYGARRTRLELKRRGDVEQAELVSAVTIGAIGFFVAAVFLHASFAYHMWFLIGLGFAMPRVAEATE